MWSDHLRYMTSGAILGSDPRTFHVTNPRIPLLPFDPWNLLHFFSYLFLHFKPSKYPHPGTLYNPQNTYISCLNLLSPVRTSHTETLHPPASSLGMGGCKLCRAPFLVDSTNSVWFSLLPLMATIGLGMFNRRVFFLCPRRIILTLSGTCRFRRIQLLHRSQVASRKVYAGGARTHGAKPTVDGRIRRQEQSAWCPAGTWHLQPMNIGSVFQDAGSLEVKHGFFLLDLRFAFGWSLKDSGFSGFQGTTCPENRHILGSYCCIGMVSTFYQFQIETTLSFAKYFFQTVCSMSHLSKHNVSM